MHVNEPSIAARWDKKYGGKIKKEGFLSMLTTKQESLDQKASKIRKAVYDELRPKPQLTSSETYGYIRDVYEDHVIYCEGEHDWEVPFTIDAEGDIQTAPRDEWTEVEQTWTEVKALREFIVRLKAVGKRGAKAPLGQGGRFAALEAKIAARGKEVTLKFNRLHDKLGHFAKKVGGATKGRIKKAIAGIARHTARSAEQKYGSTFRAAKRGKTAIKTGISRLGRAAGRNIKRSAGQKYGSTYRFLKGLKTRAKTGRRRRKEFQIPAISFVFKENDTYRWALLSSNGFRDKDGEIVSTKALERDVAQWELEGALDQPLRFWHIPLVDDYSKGLEIGACDFRMVQGHTLIESGTFLTKEIGEAVFKVQDKLAASLGFRHSPIEPDSDKIFNTIRTFERSLLPKESASNSLTYLAAYAPQGV